MGGLGWSVKTSPPHPKDSGLCGGQSMCENDVSCSLNHSFSMWARWHLHLGICPCHQGWKTKKFHWWKNLIRGLFFRLASLISGFLKATQLFSPNLFAMCMWKCPFTIKGAICEISWFFLFQFIKNWLFWKAADLSYNPKASVFDWE